MPHKCVCGVIQAIRIYLHPCCCILCFRQPWCWWEWANIEHQSNTGRGESRAVAQSVVSPQSGWRFSSVPGNHYCHWHNSTTVWPQWNFLLAALSSFLFISYWFCQVELPSSSSPSCSSPKWVMLVLLFCLVATILG